jgi:hypothetical protein
MNAEHARTARHEALHACAALRLGWPVDAVARHHDGGYHGVTFLSKTPPPGEPRDLALKMAVITLLPAIDDPTGFGCSEDLEQVDLLIRLSGVPLSEVWGQATALLDDPDFRREARAVENALYSRPLLGGAAVREVANSA